MCCWLQVHGKETCGTDNDRWNYQRVNDLIQQKLDSGAIFILPITTLLETGNHISQAANMRYESALELARILREAAQGISPWATFTEQNTLFSSSDLIRISNEWPNLAQGHTSMGDYLIIEIANYYSEANIKVEILTADAGLKAYETDAPSITPRRRM